MRRASQLLLAALVVILPSAGWAKMHDEPRSFSLEPLEGAQPLDTHGRAIIRTERLKPGRHMIAARYTPARGTTFLGSTRAGEPHEVIGQD